MGRKKQIDTSMCFRPHTDCPNYGKVGPDNQMLGAGHDRQTNTPLLRCKVCGRPFSARRGPPGLAGKPARRSSTTGLPAWQEGRGCRPRPASKGWIRTPWPNDRRPPPSTEKPSPAPGRSICRLKKRGRMSSGALFKKEAHCIAFEQRRTEDGDGWVWIEFGSCASGDSGLGAGGDQPGERRPADRPNPSGEGGLAEGFLRRPAASRSGRPFSRPLGH